MWLTNHHIVRRSNCNYCLQRESCSGSFVVNFLLQEYSHYFLLFCIEFVLKFLHAFQKKSFLSQKPYWHQNRLFYSRKMSKAIRHERRFGTNTNQSSEQTQLITFAPCTLTIKLIARFSPSVCCRSRLLCQHRLFYLLRPSFVRFFVYSVP